MINFDPPEEPDVYTHRVGRTGRAGPRRQSASPSCCPEQQADVSRVARLQGHVEQLRGVRDDGCAAARRLHVAPREVVEVVERANGSPRSRPQRCARSSPTLEGPAAHRGRSRRSRRRASSATSRRTSSTTPRRTSRVCSRRASARCGRGSTAPRSSRTPAADEVGVGSVVDVADRRRRDDDRRDQRASAAAGTVSPTSPLGSALLGTQGRRHRRRPGPTRRLAGDDPPHPLAEAPALQAEPAARLGGWLHLRSSATSAG